MQRNVHHLTRGGKSLTKSSTLFKNSYSIQGLSVKKTPLALLKLKIPTNITNLFTATNKTRISPPQTFSAPTGHHLSLSS